MPKSLAICRIGRWGVSSMIAWTFSMNSSVWVFLVVSFHSTTSKGSSDALSCALKRWAIWICILRVLAIGSVESMSCTAAHLRSRSLNIVSLSDMIEGSYCSWDLYTTGQQVDGLQQKKRNQFSFNGNGIMSFLGRQFYCYTLYKRKGLLTWWKHRLLHHYCWSIEMR